MDTLHMELGGHCERCRRYLGGVPEDGEAVVCVGCLTTEEDTEDTQAVVALLERECADLEERNPEAAQPLRAVIARVVENLDRRRSDRPGVLAGLPPAPAGPSISTDNWVRHVDGGLTTQ
jgi:hypothetical protein